MGRDDCNNDNDDDGTDISFSLDTLLEGAGALADHPRVAHLVILILTLVAVQGHPDIADQSFRKTVQITRMTSNPEAGRHAQVVTRNIAIISLWRWRS